MEHLKKPTLRMVLVLWLLITATLMFTAHAIAIDEAMVKTVAVVIEEATEDNFKSDSGEFRIIEQTVLLNTDGDVSDLRYVRLPCSVELTYAVSDASMPNALEIKVIETLRRKPGKDSNLPE